MKNAVIFECSNCGSQFAKWQGQCPECGKWNSLTEGVVATSSQRSSSPKALPSAKLTKLAQVQEQKAERVGTKIGELDRVIGGGLVKGEVVLLIGEPGIGKSTLLTQLALNLPTVVYVCGEESPSQVKIRVTRMGRGGDGLSLLPETNIDSVIATVEKEDISLLIIDSVQTMYSADLPGLAGSITQIRESTARVIAYAKSRGVPVVLVGHVTKDGEMAGPKVLEHMVDAVLELSGDRYYDLRLLRTQKNRFGATDEVGVFRMNEKGMEEVENPSEVFTAERQENVPGSCLAVVLEGTRPVLVEVQALVVDSELPVPRRVAQGVDVRRVQILLGVLQKHGRVNIGTKDVFVKVTGGLTIKEPAVDLAIAMAVASSAKNKPVPAKSVAIGEVGLLGEVRSASYMDKRVKEAKRLGYRQIYSREMSSSLGELIR